MFVELGYVDVFVVLKLKLLIDDEVFGVIIWEDIVFLVIDVFIVWFFKCVLW